MQPHHNPAVIFEIGLVAHPGDGALLHRHLPAVRQHLRQGSINILNLDRVDRAAEAAPSFHQPTIDARGAQIAGFHQPVIDRSFPLVDLLAEHLPVKGGGLLQIIARQLEMRKTVHGIAS